MKKTKNKTNKLKNDNKIKKKENKNKVKIRKKLKNKTYLVPRGINYT